MLSLKLAKFEDMPELKRMSLLFKENSPYKNYPTDEDKVEKLLIQFLSSNPEDVIILLSTKDNKTVGMLIGLAREFMFSKERHATEIAWWVDPEHRGTSGKELQEAFVYWAKKVGCKYLHMTLLQDDNYNKMKKLYKQLGFTPIEHAWVKEI